MFAREMSLSQRQEGQRGSRIAGDEERGRGEEGKGGIRMS